MTDKRQEPEAQKAGPATATAVRLVDSDRIEIEFQIDEVVKQLVKDKRLLVASCNGCNACSASIEHVDPAVRK